MKRLWRLPVEESAMIEIEKTERVEVGMGERKKWRYISNGREWRGRSKETVEEEEEGKRNEKGKKVCEREG